MFQNHQLPVHHMLLHPSHLPTLENASPSGILLLTFRKNKHDNNFYHHLLNPCLLASDYMCILKSKP